MNVLQVLFERQQQRLRSQHLAALVARLPGTSEGRRAIDELAAMAAMAAAEAQTGSSGSSGAAAARYSSLSCDPAEWQLQVGRPCSGEALLLMFDRWQKLAKTFYKKGKFDISKVCCRWGVGVYFLECLMRG